MEKPVLTPEHPWEFSYHPEDDGVGKRIYVYGTVFFDSLQGQYRMWYMSRMSHRHDFAIPELEIPGGGNIHRDLTLYATSADGIHWEKPNLGLCHFNRLSGWRREHRWRHAKQHHARFSRRQRVSRPEEEPDPHKRYKAIGFIRRFEEIRICLFARRGALVGTAACRRKTQRGFFQRLLRSGTSPLRGGEYHTVKRSALRVHQSRGATRQETGNHNAHQRGAGFGALGGGNGHLSRRA